MSSNALRLPKSLYLLSHDTQWKYTQIRSKLKKYLHYISSCVVFVAQQISSDVSPSTSQHICSSSPPVHCTVTRHCFVTRQWISHTVKPSAIGGKVSTTQPMPGFSYIEKVVLPGVRKDNDKSFSLIQHAEPHSCNIVGAGDYRMMSQLPRFWGRLLADNSFGLNFYSLFWFWAYVLTPTPLQK